MSNRSTSYQKFLGASVSAAVAASTITAGMVPAVQAAEISFSDVQSNDYFYAAVKDLSERNIIKGYQDGTFRPYETVTRAQAAKMLALTLGLETSNVQNPEFTDVKTSDWYYGPVAALVNAGIIKGYDDQTFRPNDTLTRAQMAKMIALGFHLGETSVDKFSDVKNSDWYSGYVGSLVEKEITTGTTPTTFSPNKQITRGQMAAFLYRTEQAENSVQAKQKIESIEESQVTINGTSYNVGTEVKALLHTGNKAVLKGAMVSFEEKDGTITKVTSLDLTAGSASAKEQLSFDGQNGEIAGDVTVNGDYIALKNVRVQGSLTIGQNVKNSFYSTNLTVKGNTIIAAESVKQAVQSGDTTFRKALAYKSVGASSSAASARAELTFEDAVLGVVEAARENVELSLTGKTIVKEVVVEHDISLSAGSTVSIPTMIIKEGVKAVELSGNISQMMVETTNEIKLWGKVKIKDLILSNKNGKLELGKEMQVVNVDLPEGAAVKDLIKNYNEVKGNIDKVDGKSTTVRSSGGSSSGGGGSSLKSAPGLSADTTDTQLGQDIELTFTENAAWRGKVQKVLVGGLAIDSSKYEISTGKITLDSSLFAAAQSYTIVVEADGYDDASVTQVVTAAGSGIPSTISQPGTYGSASERKTIQGNLTVTSPGVTLKNMVIEGDLLLAEGIGDGEVYLDGVEVKGKTIIKGGGENSIYFKDSVLVTVIVNKNDGRIRIVAQGDTKVVDLQLESYVKVEEDGLTNNSPGFTNVTLTSGIQNVNQDLQVQLEGSFETVNSRARNIRISLPQETSIEQLVVSAVGALVSGTGNVGTAQINAENVQLSQLPRNLVLEIPNPQNGTGSVNIGGNDYEESYSDEDQATITGIQATQGMIDLTFNTFVSGLTIDDFDITASIDGQTVSLGEMTYNPNQRKIFYTPVLDENNSGQQLSITVAPKEDSAKVNGEAQTAEVILTSGFEGRITDIFGVGAANVAIHFRSGIDNKEDEPIMTVTTDQYGYYSAALAPGGYTGEIEGDNFITSYIYAVSPSNGYNVNQNETAIYAAASNELKIALSWGEEPLDVDSHLVGPKLNGQGTFHTWYGNEIYEDNDIIYADLDWDDTQSYGPETTTIRQLTDGKYTFIVHNYSGTPALRTSNAKVEIFKGNSKEADHVFRIAEGDGEELYWTVFELEISNNGQNIEITELNELTEERPELLPSGDWAPEERTLEELQYLAENARASYEEAVEGQAVGQYKEGAKSIFLSAVMAAEELLESGSLTEEQIEEAYKALDEAIEDFENERFIEVSDYDYGLSWSIQYAEFLLEHKAAQFESEFVADLTVSVEAAAALLEENIVTSGELWGIQEQLEELIEQSRLIVPSQEVEINLAIMEAEELMSNAEEGSSPGQYHEGAIADLQAAVDEAKHFLAQGEADADQWWEAASALYDALYTFKENEIVEERSVDVAGLEHLVMMAEDVLDTAVIGNGVGEYPQEMEAALQADIEAAIELIERDDVSQTEIDEMYAAFKAKISEFEHSIIVDVSASGLADVVTEAETLAAELTDGDDQQLLQTVIDQAKELMNAGIATRLEVEEMQAHLDEVMDLFTHQPGQGEHPEEPVDEPSGTEMEVSADHLQELINGAQFIVDEHAHDESSAVDALQAEVDAANNLLQTTTVGEGELAGAIESLMRAMESAHLAFAVETANYLLEHPETAAGTVELEALQGALQEAENIDNETSFDVLSQKVHQLINAIIAVQSLMTAGETESLLGMDKVYSGIQSSEEKWAWFEHVEPHVTVYESAGFEGELSLKSLAFLEDQDQLKFTWSAGEPFADREGILELWDNNGTVGFQEDDSLIKEIHFQTVTENGSTIVQFLDLNADEQ
jgi:hypothetical protein